MPALSWEPESYDHPTGMRTRDTVNTEIKQEHIRDREQANGVNVISYSKGYLLSDGSECVWET